MIMHSFLMIDMIYLIPWHNDIYSMDLLLMVLTLFHSVPVSNFITNDWWIPTKTKVKISMALTTLSSSQRFFWWWPGFEPRTLHLLCIVHTNWVKLTRTIAKGFEYNNKILKEMCYFNKFLCNNLDG